MSIEARLTHVQRAIDEARASLSKAVETLSDARKLLTEQEDEDGNKSLGGSKQLRNASVHPNK